MRYGVLFDEEEGSKIEDLLVYYETDDVKWLMTTAVNVMHNALTKED